MAFLKKLFGKDPGKLRAEAVTAAKAGDWGDAKIRYQDLLAALAEAPKAEREAVQASINDCQTHLVRAQLSEVERMRLAGDVEAAIELCRATIEMADGLAIKASSQEQLALNLSGGTQQKVVLSKWLATEPKVLIFDEPTRGIDVGAKVEIYHMINQLAKQGVAILMVSSELPEILGMSDRIMVIGGGRVQGFLSREEATEEKIMELATATQSRAGSGEQPDRPEVTIF